MKKKNEANKITNWQVIKFGGKLSYLKKMKKRGESKYQILDKKDAFFQLNLI